MVPPSIQRRPYGTLADGREVCEFTLDNGRGLTLSAIHLGGIVTRLRVPDRDRVPGDVVLGLPSLAHYEGPHPHLGTIVGRYANRIAHGRFPLGDAHVQLVRNDGPHTLHGGPRGFGSCWWDVAPLPLDDDGSVAIALRLTSPHRDQGFPGKLRVEVRYTLTAAQEWRIDYRAETDRATVVNLSHHDYFNLAGAGSALGHRLLLNAARYCAVDAGLIPTDIRAVEGTPFDFREATAIEARIGAANPQLQIARGYDHNWVLARRTTPGLRLAARLEHGASGRAMEIHTDQPGLQFYSGNFLDGTLPGRDGAPLRQGDGVCLETQQFPDAPNQPGFGSTLLRPGETFTSSTVHRFGLCAP